MGNLMLVVTLLLTFSFTSCKEDQKAPKKGSQQEINSLSSSVSLRTTEGRAILAQLIASAINNDAVSAEIAEKVAAQRDGDTEALFEEFIPNDQLRGSSSLYSFLDKEFKKTVLRTDDKINPLQGFKDFQSFADHMVKIDPLVQLFVFSKDEEDPTIDLKRDDILTVYLPEDFDEDKEVMLTAYDKNGDVHKISSLEIPSVPVIVIGENERLEAVEKNLSEKMGRKPYYEGSHFNYFLKEGSSIFDYRIPTDFEALIDNLFL